MRTVAAFDFDGTIARGDAVVPFCTFAAGRRAVAQALVADAQLVAKVQAGRGDRDTLKASFVRRTLSTMPVDVVAEKGRAFAEKMVNEKLISAVVERIEWHRNEGHETVIVSASLAPYMNVVGQLLGFDSVLCTRLAVSDNRLTGELDGANVRADEKAARLREYLNGDDADIWAYGNSQDDYALLRMSQHPYWVDKQGVLGPWAAPDA